MNEITTNLMSIYYTLRKQYNKGVEPSPQEMMNPSIEIIKEFKDIMLHEIKDMAKEKTDDMICEDVENCQVVPDEQSQKDMFNYHYNNEIVLEYVDILEAILIYLVAFPTKEGDKIANEIISSNIADVIEKILNDDEYAILIISIYIKYLVAKSELMLTAERESEISTLRFIWNLSCNKGYETLADLIRYALLDLHKDSVAVNGEGAKTWHIFDDFVMHNSRLQYFEQNGIKLVSEEYLRFIKNYLIKVLLSDAYIDLKLDMIENEHYGHTADEKEYTAMEFIEEVADEGDAEMPDEYDIRKVIYVHFINFNRELSLNKSDDMNALDEESIERVHSLNPLSKLD